MGQITMTVICGIHRPGQGTWLAADTRVCRGSTYFDGISKILVAPNSLSAIACSGSGNAINIAERRASDILSASGALAVAEILREEIKREEWTPQKSDGDPHAWAGGWFFARGDALWWISCQLAVTRVPPDTFLTGGSGADFAQGAWWAMERQGRGTDLDMAVRAAIDNDVHCGGLAEIVFIPVTI